VIAYMVLASLNGVIVGTSRVVNGRLSTEVGPLKASLWNHVVGFLFLTATLLVVGGWSPGVDFAPPPVAYLGGFLGALFVAVNSYVFPRLGAMSAVLLVISGQMLSAVIVDYVNQDAAPTLVRWLGVCLVLIGIYVRSGASSVRSKEMVR
jgi:transporter family-2 protein